MPARQFWLVLAALCLLGLLARSLMLQEFLTQNPIAERPWTDALAYWQIAGQMAGGQWTFATPFLFAPLYPYLLGAVRAAGGGLMAAYGVQLVMHLATAVLVALAVHVRFGRTTGLVAAALFLLATEPAVSSQRLLANTLVLLLVALIWWRWGALLEQPARGWLDTVLVGLLIGALALAYPAAMLLIVFYVLWLWNDGGRGAQAFTRAAGGLAAAGAVVSLATIHNAAASGEFIPISAHSGVTLRQGNGPAAQGVYTVIAGVSPDRMQMHASAAAVYREVVGREGSWGEIDRLFRNQALYHLKANPGRAAALLARKAYWFLTGKNYDDMMPVQLEREHGIADLAVLAPLPTAYLMGAALAGLLSLIAGRKPYGPELALLLVPLLTVIIFFYSPRYRLPAVPVLCGLAAYSFVCYRQSRLPRALIIVLWILPIPLLMLNQWQGFDQPDARMRATYARMLSSAFTHAADARFQQIADEGDADVQRELARDALDRYGRAVAVYPENGPALRKLGYLELQTGQLDQAIKHLAAAAKADPTDRVALGYLYNILAERGDFAGAAACLGRLVQLDPDDFEPRLLLAWLRATCPDDRVRDADQAVRLAEALRAEPKIARMVRLDVLAAAYANAGRYDDAVTVGAEAVEQAGTTGFAGADAIAARVEGYRRHEPARARPMPLRVLEP